MNLSVHCLFTKAVHIPSRRLGKQIETVRHHATSRTKEWEVVDWLPLGLFQCVCVRMCAFLCVYVVYVSMGLYVSLCMYMCTCVFICSVYLCVCGVYVCLCLCVCIVCLCM